MSYNTFIINDFLIIIYINDTIYITCIDIINYKIYNNFFTNSDLELYVLELNHIYDLICKKFIIKCDNDIITFNIEEHVIVLIYTSNLTDDLLYEIINNYIINITEQQIKIREIYNELNTTFRIDNIYKQIDLLNDES